VKLLCRAAASKARRAFRGGSNRFMASVTKTYRSVAETAFVPGGVQRHLNCNEALMKSL
jgi:hypothetical protein